ncbi:hypothetical protein [Kribbella turkmenica]|nr:hypothetical protein [Kribbella turkmenica]
MLLVERGVDRVLFGFGHVGRRRKLLEVSAARDLEPPGGAA